MKLFAIILHYRSFKILQAGRYKRLLKTKYFCEINQISILLSSQVRNLNINL